MALLFTQSGTIARAARTLAVPIRRTGPLSPPAMAAAIGLSYLLSNPRLLGDTAVVIQQLLNSEGRDAYDGPDPNRETIPIPPTPAVPAQPMKWDVAGSLSAGYTWIPSTIYPCSLYPDGNILYKGNPTSLIAEPCTSISGSKIVSVAEVAAWENTYYIAGNGRVYAQVFAKPKEQFPPWASDSSYLVVDQTGNLRSSTAQASTNPAHPQYYKNFVIDAVPAIPAKAMRIVNVAPFPEPIYARLNPNAVVSYASSPSVDDPFDRWAGQLEGYKRPADSVSVVVRPNAPPILRQGPTTHVMAPPKPMHTERELKGKTGVAYRRALRFVSRTFGASGEAREFVTELYKALPIDKRVAMAANNRFGYAYKVVYTPRGKRFIPIMMKKPSTHDMVRAVWKNYKHLDLDKVRDGVIKNMFEDAFYGSLGEGLGEIQRRAGLPVGAGKVLEQYLPKL